MFNLRVDVHLLLSHLVILQITSLITLLLFDLERPNSTGNTCWRRAYYQDQPRPHCKCGGPQHSPIFGDSIMWTPFVVKRSNITNIRRKLVTVTPLSQGGVFQRSPIIGFTLFMSTPFDVERPNQVGNVKLSGLYQVSPPFQGSYGSRGPQFRGTTIMAYNLLSGFLP